MDAQEVTGPILHVDSWVGITVMFVTAVIIAILLWLLMKQANKEQLKGGTNHVQTEEK